jgi:hypothetical protein
LKTFFSIWWRVFGNFRRWVVLGAMEEVGR